ncbi:MAG: tetratricopeptide repeat protein [Alphaproteobacteria bacterium]|nr:tetratricopeptide repeat protein [Alphaproteobacteria bacterium]
MTSRSLLCAAFASSLGLATAGTAFASDNPAMDGDLARLEHEWARIVYQVADSGDKSDQIEALAREAAAVVQKYPGRAEPLIWDGIITSEEAAQASMFSALGYAEDARDIFLTAERIDPKALKGAIPMSLGTLYYRVPGSPVGFGDDDKARAYLETAMSMDPDGLDANYFYGDFLMEQGEYAKARQVLNHGLAAPVTPERPVWDAGRRSEIRTLLAKADEELAGN